MTNDNSKLIDAIEVEVSALLGKSRMSIKELKEISTGSVIPLDKSVNDAIDIYANNKLVAKGELLPNEDGLLVKITEIVH